MKRVTESGLVKAAIAIPLATASTWLGLKIAGRFAMRSADFLLHLAEQGK